VDRKQADIIVIGAGVVGCSIAWELVTRGARVVVVDSSSGPFMGVSRAGFGSLTPFSDPYFDGDARDYAAKAVELYRSTWIPRLSSESGIPITFQDEGLIELCGSDADLVAAHKHAESLKAAGYQAEMLTVEETRQREPALKGAFAGALFLNEPWVDVDQLFNALQLCLRRSDRVAFRWHTSVSRVITSEGRLQVQSEKHGTFDADHVILCTGLQTIALECGYRPPLKWIRGDALSVRTPDNKPLLRRHIYMKPGFITPRSDGRMLLGATYEEDDNPPAYSRENLECVEYGQVGALLECNKRILPGLASCYVDGMWHNWRPTPPDDMPILGPIAEQAGVVIATGFIGLGITMAPATATCIADFILEEKGDFPKPFDPARSFTGKPDPGEARSASG
jgi:glycine oxidase